ncbi:MAG: PepSY domain-containing protein [Sphingomonadales bacterium]|nr:PepSY domain-containing protein [Sphingomonadales bacterium]MBD3775194.1 PepSY domain-containing protein [Paracoccaceae bacterium]
MRKWHRWISVFFGIFMLFIAVTGVLSHAAALWPSSTSEAAQAALATPPAGFTCPEGWRCMPPRGDTSGFGSLTGFFHHLHSGEEFGPVGTAISILSGFALIFFSISGLWLYLQMWTNRKSRGLKGGMFWK